MEKMKSFLNKQRQEIVTVQRQTTLKQIQANDKNAASAIELSRDEAPFVAEVCRALATNTSVTKLQLKQCELTTSSDLTACSSDSSPHGDSALAALAGLLFCNRTISSLRIVQCGLTDTTAAPLLAAVAASESIRHLSLEGNGLHGGGALAGAIQGCRQLEELDLTGNQLRDDGLFAIAGALPHAGSLKALILAGNAVSDHAAMKLAAVVERCLSDVPHLHTIELGRDAGVRPETRRYLSALLESRPKPSRFSSIAQQLLNSGGGGSPQISSPNATGSNHLSAPSPSGNGGGGGGAGSQLTSPRASELADGEAHNLVGGAGSSGDGDGGLSEYASSITALDDNGSLVSLPRGDGNGVFGTSTSGAVAAAVGGSDQDLRAALAAATAANEALRGKLLGAERRVEAAEAELRDVRTEQVGALRDNISQLANEIEAAREAQREAEARAAAAAAEASAARAMRDDAILGRLAAEAELSAALQAQAAEVALLSTHAQELRSLLQQASDRLAVVASERDERAKAAATLERRLLRAVTRVAELDGALARLVAAEQQESAPSTPARGDRGLCDAAVGTDLTAMALDEQRRRRSIRKDHLRLQRTLRAGSVNGSLGGARRHVDFSPSPRGSRDELAATAMVLSPQSSPGAVAAARMRASTVASAPQSRRADDSSVSSNGFVNVSSRDIDLNFLPMTKEQWEHDDHVDRCDICDTKFGLTVRKHHCRRCGRCRCAGCAPKAPAHGNMRICAKCLINAPSSQR